MLVTTCGTLPQAVLRIMQMNNNTLIRCDNISFYRGQQLILDKVQLSVASGEIVTLIGPNGAGKTTLARIMLNLLSPTKGERWIKPDLTIGYLPQAFTPDPILPLTVKKLLQLTDSSQASIEQALAEVGVFHLLKANLADLSRGELQRVLLARTLLRKPEFLVLDEPLQGVDFAGEQELYRLIYGIKERYGCGVFIISHDLHVVMAATDKVICLNKHICCSGKPEAVAQHPEYLALFYSHTHNHSHDLTGNIKPL